MKVSKKRAVQRKAKKNQRGAAMLETALVLMTLLGMILFIMDIGRVLLTQQYASDRARVAVRNAVVNSWNATTVQNYVVYGTTSAPANNGNNQSQPVPGLMGLTTSQVTFTTFADSGIGDARYQVKISGIPLFTWIPYISGTYTAPPVIATAPVQSQGATN
jgi:Flp pilus assembly protein TadG